MTRLQMIWALGLCVGVGTAPAWAQPAPAQAVEAAEQAEQVGEEPAEEGAEGAEEGEGIAEEGEGIAEEGEGSAEEGEGSAEEGEGIADESEEIAEEGEEIADESEEIADESEEIADEGEEIAEESEEIADEGEEIAEEGGEIAEEGEEIAVGGAAPAERAVQVAAPAAPFDEPRKEPMLSLHLMTGGHVRFDEGYDALYEQMGSFDLSLRLDVHIFEGWWGGLSYDLASEEGELYQTWLTQLDEQVLRIYGAYRYRPARWLAVVARAGAAVWWSDVMIGGLSDEAVSPGIFAGVGLELSVLPLGLYRELRTLSAGLSLELLYDQVWPSEYTLGGTRLGELNPSGFGFLAGFFFTL